MVRKIIKKKHGRKNDVTRSNIIETLILGHHSCFDNKTSLGARIEFESALLMTAVERQNRSCLNRK